MRTLARSLLSHEQSDRERPGCATSGSWVVSKKRTSAPANITHLRNPVLTLTDAFGRAENGGQTTPVAQVGLVTNRGFQHVYAPIHHKTVKLMLQRIV